MGGTPGAGAGWLGAGRDCALLLAGIDTPGSKKSHAILLGAGTLLAGFERGT